MAKARGVEHNLQDAPVADTPPVLKEDRSEHHQGDHLDPADRSHFWQHPATAHDPYPIVSASEPLEYPRWVHKRDDAGAILESKQVPHAEAHAAAKADGWDVLQQVQEAVAPSDTDGSEALAAPKADVGARWVHKRDDKGTIVESKIVPHAAAYEAAHADGWE